MAAIIQIAFQFNVLYAIFIVVVTAVANAAAAAITIVISFFVYDAQ